MSLLGLFNPFTFIVTFDRFPPWTTGGLTFSPSCHPSPSPWPLSSPGDGQTPRPACQEGAPREATVQATWPHQHRDGWEGPEGFWSFKIKLLFEKKKRGRESLISLARDKNFGATPFCHLFCSILFLLSFTLYVTQLYNYITAFFFAFSLTIEIPSFPIYILFNGCISSPGGGAIQSARVCVCVHLCVCARLCVCVCAHCVYMRMRVCACVCLCV